MKKAKQVLSILLAVIMLVAAVPVMEAGASTNGFTRDSAASWMLNTVLGHGWNVDGGGAGYDCKDLALKFFEDVGGLSVYELGNALIYANSARLPDGWRRQYCSNGYRPQKGDMACWGSEYYYAGHVALVYDVDDTYIYVVEQSSKKNVAAYKTKYSISSPKCYVVPDYPSTSHNPIVLCTYIGAATDTYFRPCCEVEDASMVDYVRIAVWGTGNQSDLVWYDANYNGTSTYFRDISFSNHSPEAVEYLCDFYIYGKNGSLIVESIRYQLFAPSIEIVYFSNVIGTSFRPCCVVNSNAVIDHVTLAVWGTGDQSDLIWYDADYNGIETYFKDVDMNAHAKKASQYYCDFYVYGANGKMSCSRMIYQVPVPQITNYYVGVVTGTCFRPCCEVDDASKVDHVKLAVWATADQSDLVWYDANYNENGTYFKDVNYSAHSSSAVKYYCDFYVYGTNGRMACQRLIYCKHIWDSAAVTKAATCSSTGVKTYTCSVCGDTYTETISINSNNHVNTTNVAAVASTCTVKGYSAGVYCNDCKQYISGHVEQSLAAHQTTVINAREATYDADGYTGDTYCTVCKQTLSYGSSIPKLTKPNEPTNPTNPTQPATQPATQQQQQQSGNCKYCGGTHSGFPGILIGFFHSILAMFGLRK